MENALIKLFQKSDDMALTTQFQHGLFYDRYNESKERERLKREITKDVLDSISISIENKVRQVLDDLFKEFNV